MSQRQAEDFHILKGTSLCKAGSGAAGSPWREEKVSDLENHIIAKSAVNWEGWVGFSTGLPLQNFLKLKWLGKSKVKVLRGYVSLEVSIFHLVSVCWENVSWNSTFWTLVSCSRLLWLWNNYRNWMWFYTRKKQSYWLYFAFQTRIQYISPLCFLSFLHFLRNFQGKHSHCTLAMAQAVAVDILHTKFPNYSISGTEKTSKGPLGQPNSLAELLLRRQSDATGLDHRVLGLAELLALLPRCVEGLREMLLSLKGPFPLKLCKHWPGATITSCVTGDSWKSYHQLICS